MVVGGGREDGRNEVLFVWVGGWVGGWVERRTSGDLHGGGVDLAGEESEALCGWVGGWVGG